MKIKEAVNIINNTTETTVAKVLADDLLIFRRNDFINWFLSVPIKAMTWRSVEGGWIFLDDVYPADLARVMDVIQRLLDTPVNERFPEKKYVLSAMRCVEGPVPVKQYVDAMNISTNNVEFHFGFANEKANAMKFTQEDLDSLSGFFPKDAIDAMKEEVKDDEAD
ncbi:hypothetical protein [Limosilactobacillus reuteri]|uniref:hypothetical protein n=1 Tax=Limosilactobacillus reuteri TaxID=1598 RepID=UPI000A2D0336|nr:hypothetical protein [Limosilactobacillus reuteri]MCC4514644.1 hypothetical protein [Limosilactobacillus reuteri]OTA77836.1 hypothetical protein BHL80_01130 [Limosilactobacillus reuteri]